MNARAPYSFTSLRAVRIIETAAKVISHFVGETPWAHLDIAGVNARARKDAEWDKGATGFGVRTLVELARTFKPN